MFSSGSHFAKNVFILLSGSILAQLITLFASPILTRLFTPKDFGELSLYLTLVGIGAIIATGRYETATLLPKSNRKAYAIINLSISLALIIALISALILVPATFIISEFAFSSQIQPWFWFIPVGLLCTATYQSIIQWFNRLHAYKTISKGKIAQALVVAFVSIAIGVSDFDIYGLILAHLTGAGVLAAGWFVIWQRDSFSGPFNRLALAKEFSNFPRYTLPHSLLGAISAALPILLLTPVFGAAAIGLYALGIRVIQTPLNLIAQSIAQVLNRKAATLVQQERSIGPMIQKLVLQIMIPVSPLALLLLVYTPDLFTVLFGDAWREAGTYIQILLPWLIFAFIAGVLSFIPVLFDQQKKAFTIEIISTLFKLLGLMIGMMYNDIILAFGLYAALGSLVLLYKIIWTFQLSYQSSPNLSDDSNG